MRAGKELNLVNRVVVMKERVRIGVEVVVLEVGGGGMF